MTVAIEMRCSDGALVAPDSQATSGALAGVSGQVTDIGAHAIRYTTNSEEVNDHLVRFEHPCTPSTQTTSLTLPRSAACFVRSSPHRKLGGSCRVPVVAGSKSRLRDCGVTCGVAISTLRLVDENHEMSAKANLMSEDLLQTEPKQIGKYTYYRLGNSTLQQLLQAGLIPLGNYGSLEDKKPDGLLKQHDLVKAVVEYKRPERLRTDQQVKSAIDQEIEVARALCKILIVTDSTRSYWINAANGDRITDQDSQPVNAVFHPFGANDTTAIENLIHEIDASISATNSCIRSSVLTDPTPLAKRLWQTIWVATGKSPVKCLYNVVELFIFKFLSDLDVLPADISFSRVHEKSLSDPEDALGYYARNSRVRIYELFPSAPDGTTIINGTIFATENNEPNLSQTILFQRCLKHLNEHSQEFGSFTRISKHFKTKLYESFLNEEVEALGQYFTPRTIIQSMIRMAGIDDPGYSFTDKRICDPFCGVGGFLLEMLNLNDAMMQAFVPDASGNIAPPFVLHGFDKGFERDDERTIILAKANMLVYLAEILFQHSDRTKQFANAFNSAFLLFRNNLGTFGHIIDKEADKYDLIMTNPPYVTSGSGIIKQELASTAHAAGKYPINGLGLESLALEWITRSLRKGGKVFVIVPDGILGRIHGKALRDHLLTECTLDAVISLPQRTFFANFEHTYILVLTKKMDPSQKQTQPVFTYLVSSIGEQLTSVARREIDENDLPEMERLFRSFMANRTDSRLEASSERCKIQPIELFRDGPHWVVDRWWPAVQRRKLDGAVLEVVDPGELRTAITDLDNSIAEWQQEHEETEVQTVATVEVSLGDGDLFELFIGRRVTTDEVTKTGEIPVYSANVHVPMGYQATTRIAKFEQPTVLWGIDGRFDSNLIPSGIKFETTDHCGAIRVQSERILPEYVVYALHEHRRHEDYDRSFRASLTNMQRISLPVPVDEDGKFDIERQRQIATQFRARHEKIDEIEKLGSNLESRVRNFIANSR